jgi:LPXTG-motif cell wall-anchored protein
MTGETNHTAIALLMFSPILLAFIGIYIDAQKQRKKHH